VPTPEASQLRLLAVHAHPDDEASKGAASMARYAAEGVEVMVVTCTGGERGDVLNPTSTSQAWRPRRGEARGDGALGRDPRRGAHLAGFEDLRVPGGRPASAAAGGLLRRDPAAGGDRPLARLLREFRPHVVTTYDENGGYPHPDHIRTHEITIAAIEAAADPAYAPEDGEPWEVLKLYYHMTFHKPRLMAEHEALVGAGLESPYGDWLANWEDRPHDAERLTTLVPCGDWFEVRADALRAHATQVDPEGRWFAVPIDLQRKVWPTEDDQLARSLVETSLAEDDLFAGVREHLAAVTS
jgi:mycothiol S-conjugate amidase